MKRNRGTILTTVITIFVLGSTIVSIPAQAQTGGFTLNHYAFERTENFLGVLSHFGFLALISVSNAEDFDHITITDPNGEVILHTSEPAEISSNGWLFCATIETNPPPPGTYTITVTYIDSTLFSRSVIATASSFSSTTPIIISPVQGSNVADSTPILSWEPFESPEKGPGETLSYLIEIFHPTLALPGDDAIWRVRVPGNVSSVTYNFDGSALPAIEELIPAEYTFFLLAFEDKGIQRRTSIRSSHFTFPHRVYLPLILK